MTQENPYMKLYIQNMNSHNNTQTKQHFYHMAVNLGHIHNVLGNMISDIIKLMGNIPFENIENQKNLLKNQPVPVIQIKARNDRFAKNEKKPNSPPKQKHRPQKMEVEVENYQPNPQLYKSNDANQVQSKIDFNDFAYEKTEKPQQKKSKSSIGSFYRELLFTTDKKQPLQKQKNAQKEGSPDTSSQKTQTAQIVRYNENDRKLAAKNSFDELNKYMLEKQKDQKPYRINVKQPNEIERKIRKEKSPFFDLYDSSQSESIIKNQLFDNDNPLNFEEILIDKPYARTQIPDDSMNDKQRKILYSPQMKKDKGVKNIEKNGFQKTSNLLEITRWNNSDQENMFNVEEEIDDIESSEKKPMSRFVNNRKNFEKQQVQSETVEYVPRREQKGRKKSDRQQYQGSECPDCKAFYQAVSDDSKSFRDMCQCTSRHKSSTTFMAKHKAANFSQDFNLN